MQIKLKSFKFSDKEEWSAGFSFPDSEYKDNDKLVKKVESVTKADRARFKTKSVNGAKRLINAASSILQSLKAQGVDTNEVEIDWHPTSGGFSRTNIKTNFTGVFNNWVNDTANFWSKWQPAIGKSYSSVYVSADFLVRNFKMSRSFKVGHFFFYIAQSYAQDAYSREPELSYTCKIEIPASIEIPDEWITRPKNAVTGKTVTPSVVPNNDTNSLPTEFKANLLYADGSKKLFVYRQQSTKVSSVANEQVGYYVVQDVRQALNASQNLTMRKKIVAYFDKKVKHTLRGKASKIRVKFEGSELKAFTVTVEL